MKSRFTALLVCIIPILGLTQNDIPIGGWKSYLPANTGYYVTESPKYIFYVSNKSLTRFDKSTLQASFLSTLDGLSDINVRLAVYNEEVNALLVIYENSNIDIIYENEIVNINNIERNNNIQGDKTIFNVFFDNETAYLSTGFGVVVIDLMAAVITTSVRTPQKVTDFSIYNESFYAAMNGEVYSLPLTSFFNFQYWSLWDLSNNELELPIGIQYLESFKEKLYAASERNLYIHDGDTTVTLFEGSDKNSIPFLQKGYNYLMAGIIQNDGDDHVRFYKPENGFLLSAPCHGILNHSIEASDGRIFYGDRYGGYRYAENPEASCNFIFFDGPAYAESSDIIYKDNTLAVAGGGPNSSFQYTYTQNGFYFLKDGQWTNVFPGNTPELRNPTIFHFFRVEIDTDNDIIYAGTYWSGIVKYEKGLITILEDSTSCLEGTVGDVKRERIAGLYLDDNKDLWVSNYGAPSGLKVFRNDGVCESWNVPSSSTLADMVMDQMGLLWIRVQGNDAGLLVFDQGDPMDRSDDRFKVVSSSNSALPNNEVTALTVSRNGNIWVGTSDGLVLFACGESIFEFNCSSQPIVDPDGDGIGDFLLDDVEINAVITDGANRVWVGTDGGIIVLSPSGSEQIMQFNTDNSPLFSNEIVDFTFDEETGIMYIATGEGLMAYRTESTGAAALAQTEIYAYPNPVYPDHTGPIAIKGVYEDAIVKITDLKGRILFETEALGGQAIWDGTQWNGDRVASGVYLAWISSRSDFTKPTDAVVKIVVIH